MAAKTPRESRDAAAEPIENFVERGAHIADVPPHPPPPSTGGTDPAHSGDVSLPIFGGIEREGAGGPT